MWSTSLLVFASFASAAEEFSFSIQDAGDLGTGALTKKECSLAASMLGLAEPTVLSSGPADPQGCILSEEVGNWAYNKMHWNEDNSEQIQCNSVIRCVTTPKKWDYLTFGSSQAAVFRQSTMNEAQCHQAGTDLGFTIGTTDSYDDAPAGCLLETAGSLLEWNTADNTVAPSQSLQIMAKASTWVLMDSGSPVLTGHSVVTEAECEQAAGDLGGTWGLLDGGSQSIYPSGCFREGESFYFNSNTASDVACSATKACVHRQIWSADLTWALVGAGGEPGYVDTVAECQEAAAAMTALSSDLGGGYLSEDSYPSSWPAGCYRWGTQKQFYFNSHLTTTAPCTDEKLCVTKIVDQTWTLVSTGLGNLQSAEQCRLAAANLGGGGYASSGAYATGWPAGCYKWGSNSDFYWNSDLTSTEPCSADKQCVVGAVTLNVPEVTTTTTTTTPTTTIATTTTTIATTTTTTSSAGDDPVFRWWNGIFVSVHGSARKVFNLISSKKFMVNAMFTEVPMQFKTPDLSANIIGQVGVTLCVEGGHHTVQISNSGAVQSGGVELTTGEHVAGNARITVKQLHCDSVGNCKWSTKASSETTALSHQLTVEVDNTIIHVNSNHVGRFADKFHFNEVTVQGAFDQMHGLLGQGAAAPDANVERAAEIGVFGKAVEHYQGGLQGEGMIEGVFTDYQVSDLFSADFAFNQFQCDGSSAK